MIPRILLTLFVAGSLLFAGCLPESKNPLSAPASSLIDSRLEGVYAQRDKEGKKNIGYWHFHYRTFTAEGAKEARMTPWLDVLTVEPAQDGRLQTNRYEALATRLGESNYFSFVESPAHGKKKVLPYSFARYAVNWRGDVRVWIASNAAFANAIKAGKLRGKVIPGKFGVTVELTDTTERLAAFVAAADPKTLFDGEPLVLRRVAP
jgi:hypothetical protein